MLRFPPALVEVDLAALDALQRVDKPARIERGQAGKRLAVHLLGQRFQAADAEPADALGELLGIIQLLLGLAGRGLAVAVMLTVALCWPLPSPLLDGWPACAVAWPVRVARRAPACCRFNSSSIACWARRKTWRMRSWNRSGA